MATVIEWRRKPRIDPHTGSVEVNNGTGKPFLYIHPEDQAGALASPAAVWIYSQGDATNLTVAGKSITVDVVGMVSYATYANLFKRWWATGWVKRAWARIKSVFGGQGHPGRVFRKPIATNLQPSGDLKYEAFLSIDPPEPEDTILDITVKMDVIAITMALAGAAGTNGTVASAIAFDENGEVDKVRVLGRFGGGEDKDAKTVNYAVTVPAGGEVKVASAATGPAFVIKSGLSVFIGTTEVEIIV